MKLDIKSIKQLREETGAGMLDVKNALEKNNGDMEKARKVLIKKGIAKAAKKTAERTAGDGLVYSYIHTTGKVGSMLVVACETDFVAKNDAFVGLCKNMAMQICTGKYSSVEEFLKDDFIKDPSKKVSDLITEAIAKLGEKIELKKFVKYSVND